MYNNDDRWQGRPPVPDYEKISRKSFWQRYRWIIISAVSVVLVVFFASTTLYLLLNRPIVEKTTVVVTHLPAAAASVPTTDAAVPTQVTTDQSSLATPLPSTNQSSTSKTIPENVTLQCASGYLLSCNAAPFIVVLNNVAIDSANGVVTLNFTLTNKKSIPTSVNASSGNADIVIEDQTGANVSATGGTLFSITNFNPGQTLPATSTVPLTPKPGSSYFLKVVLYYDQGGSNYDSPSYGTVPLTF